MGSFRRQRLYRLLTAIPQLLVVFATTLSANATIVANFLGRNSSDCSQMASLLAGKQPSDYLCCSL